MTAVTILEPSAERHEEVCVPREEPVTLVVNGKELVTLLASPGRRRELAAGFLYCEGLVRDPAQLVQMDEDEAGVRIEVTGADLSLRLMERRVLGSGCGKAVGFVTALDAFADAARSRSVALFSEPPWVHAAVLCAAALSTYTEGALYRCTRGHARRGAVPVQRRDGGVGRGHREAQRVGQGHRRQVPGRGVARRSCSWWSPGACRRRWWGRSSVHPSRWSSRRACPPTRPWRGQPAHPWRSWRAEGGSASAYSRVRNWWHRGARRPCLRRRAARHLPPAAHEQQHGGAADHRRATCR